MKNKMAPYWILILLAAAAWTQAAETTDVRRAPARISNADTRLVIRIIVWLPLDFALTIIRARQKSKIELGRILPDTTRHSVPQSLPPAPKTFC